MSDVAFKILTCEQWAQFERDRIFHGAPIDLTDGYIHLSAAEQLRGTLHKHFSDQDGLVIAEIDLAKVAEKVKWEEARDGALFPHIYGDLPIEAVISAKKLSETDHG